MSLNQVQKQSGFTIVELLIVIVIIAILAAISIFGYNGFINRGKASAAQQLSSQVSKKVEAYNAVEGAYPTFAEFQNNRKVGETTGSNTAAQEARLDNTASISSTAPTSTGGESVVRYLKCTAGGAQVGWYDFSKTANQVTYVGLGGAASGTTACT